MIVGLAIDLVWLGLGLATMGLCIRNGYRSSLSRRAVRDWVADHRTGRPVIVLDKMEQDNLITLTSMRLWVEILLGYVQFIVIAVGGFATFNTVRIPPTAPMRWPSFIVACGFITLEGSLFVVEIITNRLRSRAEAVERRRMGVLHARLERRAPDSRGGPPWRRGNDPSADDNS